ncbi:MAG: DUF2231 domain-containing protein [Cyclobacteriaceae bacterium]
MKTIQVITEFLGRFHPLLVHLPIGMLLLGFIFECLSARERYRLLKNAIPPSLLLGTVFAIAAAITGYFLRQEGGYEESLADLHQNAGIGTAVLSLIVYVLRARLKFWIINPANRKQARIALFIPLIILLSITGHLGGSLTHGEDYLFAPISSDNVLALDPKVRIDSIVSIPDAVMYRDVIQPIFEARCYDCHSSRKQKGDLRLDKEDFIVRGGKHGEVISDDVADSSNVYKRLMLPLEDKHHMPPNEKPQLSSSEIALIKYWIEDKPLFSKQISAHESSDKIIAIIESLQQTPQQSWMPVEKIEPASEKTLLKIIRTGLHPMPMAENSPYLMVTFTNSRMISDEHLKGLMEIKDQLVWVNLSNTNITDAQLNILSKLSNIRILYLNNAPVTDAGLSRLVPLTELRMLNLIGTSVTDSSVSVLLKFQKLSTLFLYQTKMTKEGIQKIVGERQDIKLDTGNYTMEKLPTDTIIFKKISQND